MNKKEYEEMLNSEMLSQFKEIKKELLETDYLKAKDILGLAYNELLGYFSETQKDLIDLRVHASKITYPRLIQSLYNKHVLFVNTQQRIANKALHKLNVEYQLDFKPFYLKEEVKT